MTTLEAGPRRRRRQAGPGVHRIRNKKYPMNITPQIKTSYWLKSPTGRFAPILVELEDFTPVLVNGKAGSILTLPIGPVLVARSGTLRLYYLPAEGLWHLFENPGGPLQLSLDPISDTLTLRHDGRPSLPYLAHFPVTVRMDKAKTDEYLEWQASQVVHRLRQLRPQEPQSLFAGYANAAVRAADAVYRGLPSPPADPRFPEITLLAGTAHVVDMDKLIRLWVQGNWSWHDAAFHDLHLWDSENGKRLDYDGDLGP
jgi:hypothetical protein